MSYSIIITENRASFSNEQRLQVKLQNRRAFDVRMRSEKDLNKKLKLVCERSLDDLTEILLDHESWNDPLSKRMFKWGAKVLQFDLTKDLELSKVFQSNVKKQIDRLATKILVNHLDKAPLKNPLLVNNEFVWEEWMLNDYLDLPKTSSFDQEQFKNVVPHAFAQEMLEWMETINSFLPVFDAPSTSLIPVQGQEGRMVVNKPIVLSQSAMTSHTANAQQVAQFKLISYTMLVQNMHLKRNMRSMRKEIEHSTRAVELFREQMQLIIREEKALAERQANAHEQALNQRIGHIEKAHETTVNVLNSRIDANSQQLKNAQEKLELTDQNCRSKEVLIQNLLQEEIRRAELSIVHERQIEQQIGRIETTHQNNVNVLNSRIDEESNRHRATRVQLNQTEKTCQEQAASINQLRSAYAQKAAEVAQLQNQNNDSGWCSIM
jgi:hypothetical protein